MKLRSIGNCWVQITDLCLQDRRRKGLLFRTSRLCGGIPEVFINARATLLLKIKAHRFLSSEGHCPGGDKGGLRGSPSAPLLTTARQRAPGTVRTGTRKCHRALLSNIVKLHSSLSGHHHQISLENYSPTLKPLVCPTCSLQTRKLRP